MLYFTNNVLTHTQLSKWQCGGVTSEGEHSLVVVFFFSDDKGACPDSSVLNSLLRLCGRLGRPQHSQISLTLSQIELLIVTES